MGNAERKVLDVGCGLQSSVMIPGTTRLVGIDLDGSLQKSLASMLDAGVELVGGGS